MLDTQCMKFNKNGLLIRLMDSIVGIMFSISIIYLGVELVRIFMGCCLGLCIISLYSINTKIKLIVYSRMRRIIIKLLAQYHKVRKSKITVNK